jgi:hypothetical protein
MLVGIEKTEILALTFEIAHDMKELKARVHRVEQWALLVSREMT